MADEETAHSLAREAPITRRGSSQSQAVPTEEAIRAADAETFLRRLAGKPAVDILSRISNGDPLQVYPLCSRRIRELYFVLDPDRVFERALSVVAVGMEVEAESCASPGWLVGRVDRAIHALLEHDRDEERSGLPPERPHEHFKLFIKAFYVEPPLSRLASVRLNSLDERVRKGFQKLLIEGLPLEECLALDLGPPERLQLDILTALKAIGLLNDAGVEELRWKGNDQP